LVAIYELDILEIFVIGHHDCGMQGLEASQLIKDMMDRNISQEKIDMVQNAGIDIHKWLSGFENTETSVSETVKIIKNHP
jgi:carbonic anhydrase